MFTVFRGRRRPTPFPTVVVAAVAIFRGRRRCHPRSYPCPWSWLPSSLSSEAAAVARTLARGLGCRRPAPHSRSWMLSSSSSLAAAIAVFRGHRLRLQSSRHGCHRSILVCVRPRSCSPPSSSSAAVAHVRLAIHARGGHPRPPRPLPSPVPVSPLSLAPPLPSASTVPTDTATARAALACFRRRRAQPGRSRHVCRRRQRPPWPLSLSLMTTSAPAVALVRHDRCCRQLHPPPSSIMPGVAAALVHRAVAVALFRRRCNSIPVFHPALGRLHPSLPPSSCSFTAARPPRSLRLSAAAAAIVHSSH